MAATHSLDREMRIERARASLAHAPMSSSVEHAIRRVFVRIHAARTPPRLNICTTDDTLLRGLYRA